MSGMNIARCGFGSISQETGAVTAKFIELAIAAATHIVTLDADLLSLRAPEAKPAGDFDSECQA